MVLAPFDGRRPQIKLIVISVVRVSAGAGKARFAVAIRVSPIKSLAPPSDSPYTTQIQTGCAFRVPFLVEHKDAMKGRDERGHSSPIKPSMPPHRDMRLEG